MSVVGFDIGNETCYIATARSGGIEVIDNEYSSRMTPSYVGFTEKSRVMGTAAKSKLTSNINNTIFGFKTLLGKKYSNAKSDFQHLPFDIRELPSDEIGIAVKYLNSETVFTVHQAMAMILTKLKSIAEVKLGSKVQECVLSVPIYYTDIQRRAMLDAAEISGLKVLKLMNESTAIALAYGFYKPNAFSQAKTVVFIDMGQSAMTATAGVFSQDKLTILGSVWNTKIGGRDFDLVLVQYFAEEFRNKYNMDIKLKKKAVMALMLECEALKKQMSMNSRDLTLNIECLMNDIDVNGKMNRDTFEQLSSALLESVENTLRDLLTQVKLDKNDIHEVQIVGGSCRIPALKSIISRVFGQDPRATLNQDESVARGCALQCAFLSPTLKTKEYVIDDIQPFAINVSTFQNSFSSNEVEVFSRFHKVPASKKLTYNFKNPFNIKAYYSDSSLHFVDIGKFYFSEIPSSINENSCVSLKIMLSIDANGILKVTSATMEVKEIPSIEKELSNLMAIVPNDENTNQSQKQITGTESETGMDLKTEDEKNKNHKEKIKSFVLNIQEDISSLSTIQLNQLINEEQEMLKADLQQKKLADLRNVVEEYVYQTRQKLTEEFANTISSDKNNLIFALLNETEVWLYDTDSQSEEEYLYRMDELKSQIEPVWINLQNYQNVKFALDELKYVLELVLTQIQSFSEQDYSDECDIKSLQSTWNQKNEVYLDCMKVLNETDLSGDGILIKAEYIRSELDDLKNKVNCITNKTVPKATQPRNSDDDPSNDLNLHAGKN